jgi:hypothetical protein
MNLERRYRARHPVDLGLYIRYRKRRLHRARALNLSAGGIYLNVQSVTLPSGTLLELELESQGKDWRIPAVVVHQSGSGVGVMFRYPQPELFDDIMRFNRKHCPEAMSRSVATTKAQPA